jgi:hypothetical protein
VEENVVTPSTTVVEDDGSWIGRTIVTLVILGLLVAGAVWLVRSLADNDNGSTGNNGDNRQIEQNQQNPNNNNDTGNVQPSAVIPS